MIHNRDARLVNIGLAAAGAFVLIATMVAINLAITSHPTVVWLMIAGCGVLTTIIIPAQWIEVASRRAHDPLWDDFDDEP